MKCLHYHKQWYLIVSKCCKPIEVGAYGAGTHPEFHGFLEALSKLFTKSTICGKPAV